MSVLNVIGIVTSKTDDVREFQREGKTERVDVINVHLSDVAGVGNPVQVDVSKSQLAQFKLWGHYSLPVNVRAYPTRNNGAGLSLRVPEDVDVMKCLVGSTPNPVSLAKS